MVTIPVVRELAESTGHPLVLHSGSEHLAGRSQWERFLDSEPVPAALEQVYRGLLDEQAAQTRRAGATERVEEAFRGALDPDTPGPLEALDTMRAEEARAAAEHAQSTEGLLERILGVLEDVRSELLKR